MRSISFALGSAFVLGALAGCAETPPPAAPTINNGPPAPAQVAATPVDLTPVAEPADIFVTARWKNPNATMHGLSACANVPEGLADDSIRALIGKGLSKAFRGGIDGRQIADILAYDASVDFVVSLDASRRSPSALYAFSVGLTSLDRAKQVAQGAGELVEVAPGLFRLGAKESGDLACVVGAAAGAAPARLICGHRDKDITTLGPYLARNVPVSEPPKNDMHAELRFAPIDARYGGDIRRGLGFLPNLARARGIGESRFDAALEEAATALAEEGSALAGDLDRVTVDFTADGGTCLTAKTALQMRGSTSWVAQSIAESSAKSGPPPALFWRAPVDSGSASYGRAADPARYAGILRTLRGFAEGGLAKEKIGSEADRKALASLLNLPFAKGTSFVVASGHAQGGSKQPAGAKLDQQQLADELVGSYLGWYMIGFDEGPEAITKLLKDLVAVYGRKGLTDPLRKAIGKDARMLPTLKFVTAPRQLGKGAQDLEIKFEIEPKAGEKPIVVTVHALVMADGKSSWLGFGANRDEVVKHLLMAKSGAPDSGTLSARAGLEPLRNGKAVSSGFVTLGVLTRGIGSVLDNQAITSQMPGGAGPVAELGRALHNLPNKGDTPIFVVTDAQREGPRSETSLQVQKGSLEDLGVLVMTAVNLAGKAGLLQKPQP
ncbi:Hypothetical protein A7982_09172 [Minicystis rosea]|nr:Hypothetical protein A7982_09172 [Minicystis rosea]